MIDPPRLLAAVLLGAVALPAAAPASAQTWKPDKNVEIVVSLTAGSNQDRTSRTLQNILDAVRELH